MEWEVQAILQILVQRHNREPFHMCMGGTHYYYWREFNLAIFLQFAKLPIPTIWYAAVMSVPATIAKL